MRTTSIPTLACFAILACSGSGSEQAATTTSAREHGKADGAADQAPQTKPDAEAKPDTEAKPDATADKRAKARANISVADPTELKARRGTMLAALNEGRKLVKDGQVEAGIAKYQELLAIDPHYGPALGELGWAEFQAGKLDDAHAHTLRALSVATDQQKRGMLLYNLGRIAEQRGQTDAAIDHYRESLQARPNQTVSARLASLAPDAVAAAAAAPPDRSGLGVLASGLADIEAVCQTAGHNSLCGVGDSCELVATPDGDDSWGTINLSDFGMLGCWNPVVKTPAGWVLFETEIIAQHGSEVDQDVDAIASRVVNNDAGEFLLIEYGEHIYERAWDAVDLADENDGFPPEDLTDSEGVIICRRDGDGARCTPTITVKYDFRGSDDARGSYTAELELRGDTIVISNVTREGKLPEGNSGWVLLDAGQHSFEQLAPSTGK